MTARTLLTWLTMLLAVAFTGCGQQSSETPLTEAEVFVRDQTDIETPHGKIILDSVEEADDGKVRYTTEDGSHWETDQLDDGDGTYKWGEPTKVDSK